MGGGGANSLSFIDSQATSLNENNLLKLQGHLLTVFVTSYYNLSKSALIYIAEHVSFQASVIKTHPGSLQSSLSQKVAHSD
jgi:hypothetical protein